MRRKLSYNYVCKEKNGIVVDIGVGKPISCFRYILPVWACKSFLSVLGNFLRLLNFRESAGLQWDTGVFVPYTNVITDLSLILSFVVSHHICPRQSRKTLPREVFPRSSMPAITASLNKFFSYMKGCCMEDLSLITEDNGKLQEGRF